MSASFKTSAYPFWGVFPSSANLPLTDSRLQEGDIAWASLEASLYVYDGTSWQVSAGSSAAAGGANEIQYNDGSNALTASSGLTFDGTTLAINSIGPSALTVSSTIDGQFLDVNTNLYQLTLLDPTQLPLNVNATLGPSDLAIYDDNVSQSGNVQAGLVGVFDNATTNNLKMIVPAGVATIKSEDALSAAQDLNLSIRALQVNTDPGTSGYVLTSNGAGSAPTWQAPAGGFAVGSVTTNDDVPTSALSLTPASNTAVVYKATIAARKQGSNNGASYGLVGAFKEDGGTVTQIGTTTSLWSFEDTAALDAQLVIAGSDVEVQVTGEATTYPGGVTYIDPVSPPAPSGTTWTVGTLGGEDFADIATALADASVVNGDRLLLSAETFTVASTITVSKEVTIQGAGLSSTIIQTANTAGDPVTVINITTNNVTIRDLTVKQRKTTNTSIEVAISINPATPIGSSGHYLEAVRVETMEFGVYVRSDGWQINNCQLAYVGANNTTRRLIGIYRSNGQGIIANTTYDSAEGGVITGATRVITVVSTVGTPSERFGGYFRVTNVTPVVSSTVSQFFNCESFPVGGDPLEFVVDNCTSSESSAFIVFFVDRTNLLSGFSYIALTDNTISGNHGGSPIGTKGLFAVDGTAAGANSMGTTTFYVDGNTIGNTTFRTGWSTILNTGLGYTASQLAQAGFDGVYYTNPSLSISTATVNSWDWTASVETVSAP